MDEKAKRIKEINKKAFTPILKLDFIRNVAVDQPGILEVDKLRINELFTDIEKELTVLEIIKKHCHFELKEVAIINNKTIYGMTLNNLLGFGELTKEEFDLLKELLK